MKRVIIPLVVILGAAFCVGPAEGGIITIAIEGVVDYAYDPCGFLGADIEVGDVITGTYTYDSARPDSCPEVFEGQYWHDTSPAGVRLTVEGFTFESATPGVDFLVLIGNDTSRGRDFYGFASFKNVPLSSGVRVDRIAWEVADPSRTALATDELPTTGPVLGDWVSNSLLIGSPPRDGAFWIEGHVTSAVVVPEPGTFLLFGAGTLAVCRRFLKT